ncbi:MAG: DNA polymerase III subunit delta' [Proteobacteria bacterium]|nr:DNA polymerase III subunit delta' [Pseudomonadota bacterium]
MSIDQRVSDFDRKTAISQTISELTTIVQAGTIPNALLFSGNPGTGKQEAAFEFAKACNCRTDTQNPCNTCVSCKKISTGMHPDIIQISPADKKKIISIAQIREIGGVLSSKPNEAAKRMVLIQDADLMNAQAQNALLKVLEEPPENTFFILTATRLSPLLPTILSRCRQIRFKPLSCRQIQQFIMEQHAMDPQWAYIAAQTAGSDLQKALMLLNLDKTGETGINFQKRRTWIIKELMDIVSKQPHTPIGKGLMLSQKLSLDPDLVFDAMAIIRTVLRDFCVFKYSPEKIVNLDFFDAFNDIGKKHVYTTFLKWMNDFAQTEKRLVSNSSIRLTLDRFFLGLSIL